MIYLSFFDIDERVIKASEKAMELCKDKLAEIDNIQEFRYLRMVIVTTAVYWGLNSPLRQS